MTKHIIHAGIWLVARIIYIFFVFHLFIATILQSSIKEEINKAQHYTKIKEHTNAKNKKKVTKGK